jgi:protein-tyrosine phosphatase
MIDIHTHILPQIDDGPSDWSETLDLLRQGISDGINGVVCTSHVINCLDEEIEEKIISKFRQLEEIVQREKLEISIWLASEIHCNSKFNFNSRIATFNGNKKYILIELPLGDIPADIGEKLFKLSLEGVTPILAHPERNLIILQKPEVAYEFVQRGILIQMNSGSITGIFGRRVKKVAIEMLNHNLIHFVASDCHSIAGRPMLLNDAYKFILKNWGKTMADQLMQVNPYKAIMGEDLSLSDPIPFKKKSKMQKGFLRSLIYRNI